MKKCPSCQKTYEDSMKFCQIDGTPLVDDAPPVDPYKTIVSRPDENPLSVPGVEPDARGESLSRSAEPVREPILETPSISAPDDVLEVSSSSDPLKTMYVSEEEMREAMGSIEVPEVPKAEPDVNVPAAEPGPPSFIASEVESQPVGSAPQELPFSGEPAGEQKRETSPASAFDATNPPIPSPFDAGSLDAELKPEPADAEPEGALPAAMPEPETVIQPIPPASPFSEPQPSFTPESSSTAAEPPPFAEPEPFQPAAAQQFETASPPAEWTPPPAPDASWQNQQIGQDTPFQAPPPGTGTQSKGLAIGSLVCGILSCLCCFSVITGPIGVVLGFIARKKATEDPQNYGGDGLALGGMITGALGFVIGVALIILQLFFGVLNNLAR